MRWEDGRRSDNVEDRRGESSGGLGAAAAAPVVLRLLPRLVRSRMGRLLLLAGVALFIASRFMGGSSIGVQSGGAGAEGGYQGSATEEQMKEFLSVILAQTEDMWRERFAERGLQYTEPTLVLFSDRVNSACGMADAAVGPFYCPADQQIYVDMSFFRDLAVQHGAPGDFAQGYVLAHEVGHHVQNLLGISGQVQKLGRGRSKDQVNALSVRQELQADCFAGIWGHTADFELNRLDPGDLEEALRAATAIGDDRLQREAGRRVVPDSFTHGSSAQRVRWFRTGFERGRVDQCDTFSARQL
jgi:predicted metalloprotease